MREQIDLIMAMLQDDFDYEAHDYPQIGEEFRRTISTNVTEAEAKYIECGSCDLEDTPYALYRLLWLVNPSEPIDFSDMYKHEVLAFMSADKRFLVSAYLFKYELALYFYALRELVDTSEASAVWAGMPGAYNGTRCTDDDGNAFFEMVRTVLNTEHCVYGGNNFDV